MNSLGSLLGALLALIWAIRQIRENRARRIPIDWPKTIAAALACIAITALGLACLFVGLNYNSPILGISAFVVIVIVGIGIMAMVFPRWRQAAVPPRE